MRISKIYNVNNQKGKDTDNKYNDFKEENKSHRTLDGKAILS
jgi:hypothetical protein